MCPCPHISEKNNKTTYPSLLNSDPTQAQDSKHHQAEN